MSGEKAVALPHRPVYSACTVDGEHRERFTDHLEAILASPVFRNSKRYAAVLRYVVEKAFDGHAERLKERNIGVDVFGRPADYDTASDHVVRSAMAEVRKRLAQYYQERGENSGLRIEVQPGSYIPQFREIADRFAPVAPEAAEPETEVTPLTEPVHRRRVRWKLLAGIGIVTVACAALITFLVRGASTSSDPLTRFWQPVLASPNPILLCIGNLEGGNPAHAPALGDAATPGLTLRAYHTMPSQTVHIADASTLARLAGFLGSRAKPFRVATQSEADFQDLRNGPSVLIGLFNNDWTERLVGKLRFTIEHPGPGKFVIRDSQQPSRANWSIDSQTPVAEITRDYAIILRAVDSRTDQAVVTAGGISVFGTVAAGEFLTSARELQQLDTEAPKGWPQRNIEVVLSTEVIRGKSGRPKVVATYVW
ncbi:MAG TPA: hypothetical protein VMH81_00445 [Bryobacteraceae bacterium]|nr:hypothetical protein [Bryobacteraceae bacterium]